MTHTTSNALGAALGRVVSVKSYGALGDGSTDDRPAIQAAIKAANAGDTILFPDSGVYMCGFTSGIGLTLKAGIRLRGPGATLKITSGPQAWTALLDAGTNGQGVIVEDLTIDCNYTGRPITDATLTATTDPRFVFRALAGDDITIRRVTVTGHSGRNTVYCSGTGLDRVTVDSCKFLDVGNSPAGQGFDHSTVYITAITARVVNNEFIGTSPLGAHAAIETHAPSQIVTGNVVQGYSIMANITGVAATDSDNVVVTGNIGRQLMDGIALYAMSTLGGVSPALRNLTIAHNAITLDRDYHLPFANQTLVRSPRGIYMAATSDRSVNSVDISHNQIYFAAYSAAANQDENAAAGVVFYRSTATPDQPDMRVRIENNSIVNPPGPGIRYADACKQLRIVGNTIIDPGGTNSATASTFKTGVILGANAYQDVEIARNTIIDTRATHLMTSAVDVSVITSVINGRIVDNNVRCTDGTSLAGIVLASGTGKGFYVEHEMDTWLGIFKPLKPGSKVRARDTGITWVNTMVTDGTNGTFVQQVAGKATLDAALTSATTLGTVIGKVQVWSSNGSTVLGYYPVYNTIT